MANTKAISRSCKMPPTIILLLKTFRISLALIWHLLVIYFKNKIVLVKCSNFIKVFTE